MANILIACEYSGIVRNAFTQAGYNALSCDLLPTQSPGQHIIGDALKVIYSFEWDLIIAHPPCTYLCKAQLPRVYSSPEQLTKTISAANFVACILAAPCPKIAVENPIGWLNTHFRPPDQITYAYNFGSPYSKDICLWLKGLPPLISTCYNTRKKSVSNHVNSRMPQWKRSLIRSRFFPEVAAAMAQQWGSLL
jgi:hypothetical protein